VGRAVTRGTTVYFFDPFGNRNETFGVHSAYQLDPAHKPICWTEDDAHVRELGQTFSDGWALSDRADAVALRRISLPGPEQLSE
jgi:hypothetical protein